MLGSPELGIGTAQPRIRDIRHWPTPILALIMRRMIKVAEPMAVPGALPYGPRLTRLLRPLQRGFLAVNQKFMAPLIRNGFGWLVGNPMTGHLMLLRTRGRRSGLLREAPLGYVIRDGAVYCVAGYGEPTPWFRNLVADPNVEVVLPTRRFQGHAEPVTDPAEWLATYRALIESFGLVGRAVVGDVRRLDDATLLERHRALPVVRITPRYGDAPLVAGPFDPGGLGWILPYGATLLVGAAAWRLIAASCQEGLPGQRSVIDAAATTCAGSGYPRPIWARCSSSWSRRIRSIAATSRTPNTSWRPVRCQPAVSRASMRAIVAERRVA